VIRPGRLAADAGGQGKCQGRWSSNKFSCGARRHRPAEDVQLLTCVGVVGCVGGRGAEGIEGEDGVGDYH